MKMALAKETSKLLSPSWGQALQRFTSTTSKVSATKASTYIFWEFKSTFGIRLYHGVIPIFFD